MIHSLCEALNYFENKYGILEPQKEIPNHPGYKCDPFGNVWRPDGKPIKPFKSCGYKQVYLRDSNGKRSIKGVHQVVAMTYSQDWFDGCIVHHKDEDKHNNYIGNLKCETLQEHARHHANSENVIRWIRKNGPHNKGKKMSPEFCEACRKAALKRYKKQT